MNIYLDKQRLIFYIIPTIAYLRFSHGWAIEFEWGWWSIVVNDAGVGVSFLSRKITTPSDNGPDILETED